MSNNTFYSGGAAAIRGTVLLAGLLAGFRGEASLWTNLVSGNASGSWGTAANWSGGIPNATNAVADFSTLNLGSNSTVTNDSPRTVGSLFFSDTSPSGNTWVLNGGASTHLTLAVSSGQPVIGVTNSQVILGGISGSNGLVLNGNGALAIFGTAESNSLAGPIVVNGGLLGTVNGKAFKGITGSITVASGASFEANDDIDGTTFTNGFFLSGTGGSASGYVNNAATPDGTYNGEPMPFGALDVHGNVTLSGTITLNADSAITHGYNVATLNGPIIATGAGKNLAMNITVNGQYALTANGGINLGTGGLTVGGVANGASITMAGTNNWAGVTVLSNGIAIFNTTNALGGSAASISLNPGGTATLSGTNLNLLLGRVTANSAGAIAFNGVSSAGALSFTNCPGLSLGALGNSAYSGVLTPGGGNYQLGGGGGTLTVSSGLTNAAAGLTVNGNTAGSTVVVTGGHTYGGTTTVAGGTLVISGPLAGPVAVLSGGTISPGPTNTTGTLTVSNTVTLGGTAVFSINRTNAQNADLLTANSLSLGGVLTVTNTGPAPVLGDTFQLFNVSGVFSNGQPVLNLPALSAGLMWKVNNLSVNGTIQVGQLTNTIGETNWPSLLPGELQAAQAAGYTNITINPGTYMLANGNSAAFSLTGWTNVTVNATNAVFASGYGDCFDLNNCTNVVLAGATVRPQNYPFTQGRVTAIGTNNGILYCNWQISAGYATTNFQWWFNAVSASNLVINLVQGDIYYGNQYGTNGSGVANNATYLGNQTWQLSFPGWFTSFSFQTNDWLVARVGSQGFAYYLNGSTNCTLLDCTSQSGGFATYRENLGGGNHMLGCQIQTSPAVPPGGTEAPVVSAGADGVHTTWTFPGMDLENCGFTGAFLDDNIAIHGSYENVVSSSGNTVTFDGPGMFAVGDPVRISSTNGSYFAQANCTAIANLGNGNCQLTLDQTLTVPAGTAGSDPKYNGSGYKVINCRLGNVRSRAILCKADNGLISGNWITNAQTAIELGPEIYWGEGDYVWNVTVTNNTVQHCGSEGFLLTSDGALGNMNLTIVNNWFQNVFQGNAVNLTGAGGVTLAGNTFINPAPGYALVQLAASTNAVFSGNLISNVPAGLSLVGTGSGVSGLHYQQTGLLPAGIPVTFVNGATNLVIADPAAGGAGTQAVQQTGAGGAAEHWVLTPAGNGGCALICVTNGLALGVNGSTASNAAVVMETYTGSAGQLWTVTPVTNNCLALVNQLSGMAVQAISGASGLGLVQRPYTGSTNQEWLLLSAPSGLSTVQGTNVVLSWAAVTGATGYAVTRASSTNGPYVLLATNLTATSYTDTNTLGGGTYYYVVTANLGSITTAGSAPAMVLVTAYSWDSDGNSANGMTDGGGTWGGTNLVWFSSASVADTNWPGGFATAVFGKSGAGTVTVNGTQSVSGLTFNTGYLLTGGMLAIFTNGPLAVVNNANVTVASLLTGSQALVKTGTGALTLSNANTYSGGTTVSQATVVLGTDNALGTGSVTVQSGPGNPTVELDLNGHVLTNFIAGTGGDCYVFNSSATTATLAGPVAFGSYTRIGFYSQTTPGVGNINCPGTLIGGWNEKQGAGVLALTGTNTYTGNTYVTGGAVRALDGTGITGANLDLAGGVFESLGPSFVRAPGTAAGQVQLPSGSSGFSAYGTPVTLALGGLATPAALTWGTAYFNPATLVLNYNSANNVLTVLNAINLNGTNRSVKVNAGVVNLNAALSDSMATGAGLTVGGAGGMINFNGTNTYTGTTTVTNGTLGGTGSLAGPLTVQSGATLNPGSGLGTFTVSNTVSLAGTLLMDLNETNSPNGSLLMAAAITCGGTLLVTNLGPGLTNRAAFKLFAASLGGSFAVTNLPALGMNLAWSNSLAANGTLTVVSTAAQNPTNISFQVVNGGTGLQLSWPTNHLGWWLQSQTSSVAAGLGATWFNLAGSSLTNQLMQNLDGSNGCVFYRLAAP